MIGWGSLLLPAGLLPIHFAISPLWISTHGIRYAGLERSHNGVEISADGGAVVLV